MPRAAATTLLLLVFASSVAAEKPQAIRIAPDGKGFITADTHRRFVPWGFNYGCFERLIEDYWLTDWPRVERDFAEMHRMGGNVVRVHLQVTAFLDAPDKANETSLKQLAKLIDLAERTGLYLDVTGLACYRTKDVPAWYDALDERGRWAAQATFWQAVANVTRDRPGVFCLDLMNEPFSAGGKREPRQWYSGSNLGGFDFMQFIDLDQAGREREEVPRLWIRAMTAAIRQRDTTHPITVGMLPWVPGWNFLSGFVPDRLAGDLDFIAVHLYPEAGKLDDAKKVLAKFAIPSKPLVIEETFPLSCSTAEWRQFLLDSRPTANGWIAHYPGQTLAELQESKNTNKITPTQAAFLNALETGQAVRDEMTR